MEAPNGQGEWIPITEKTKIEQCCMDENIRKSTQASLSPTMQRDQRQLLGWKAQTIRAQQIIDGTIEDTSGIHPDIIELIPYLRKPIQIQQNGPIDTGGCGIINFW